MKGPICISCESGDHELSHLTEGFQKCACACHQRGAAFKEGYNQGALDLKFLKRSVEEEELTLP